MSWTPDDVWINWYGRVDDPETGTSKIYLIVINESNEARPVTLQIANMYPSRKSRTLSHYIREPPDSDNVWWKETPGVKIRLRYRHGKTPMHTEPFDPSTDTTDYHKQSAVVTDTASFNAPSGITVLVLNDANFAPYCSNVTYQSRGKYPVNAVPSADLAASYLRMYLFEDATLIGNDDNNRGRFYITRPDDSSFPTKPINGHVVKANLNPSDEILTVC